MDSIGSISCWHVRRMVPVQDKLQNSHASREWLVYFSIRSNRSNNLLFSSAVDCGRRLVECKLLSALAHLWTVWHRVGSNIGRRIQFTQPFSMGHELSMDRCRLFIWLWWLRQHYFIRTNYLSILTSHILRILGAPDCHPFHGTQLRFTVTFGSRLNGKDQIEFDQMWITFKFDFIFNLQIVMFFGQVVLSYLLSFIISLSFEAPVVTMLKILTPNRKKILVENRD